MKSVLRILLAFTLFFGFTTYAFAEESVVENKDKESKEVVKLVMSECVISETDNGGIVADGNLYEVDPVTRAVKLAGNARYKLNWDGIIGKFEGTWHVKLTNGDLIKSVYGEMIIKKDNFGPFNPILATIESYGFYEFGTLYPHATGTQEAEYYGSEGNIHYNTNVILQWRDFFVEGITKSYYVEDGERQGTISELSIYDVII